MGPARSPLKPIVEGGAFFEAPRWRDGRWWVSDFFRRQVWSFTCDGSEPRVEAVVPGQPSGLGWDVDGRLLVVSMLDHRLLRRSSGAEKLEVVADLSRVSGGQSNDMVVDATGRAWVGNFGFDLHGGAPPVPTSLARVDPDGTVAVAAQDLLFPNGAVVSADGATLIVGETFGSRYTAFTILPEGTLGRRRTWADLPGVRPDGCCLDADGRIWCADAGAGRALLVEEGGRIVREITAPDGLGVFACMLGGPSGTTLLLCCCPRRGAAVTDATRSAVLLTVEVDRPHAGLP